MEMTKQAFSVPAMHCPSCVMLLEGLEDEVPGIRAVKADFKKQRMVVEYDGSEISVSQIIEAAQNEGYRAEPIISNQKEGVL